MRQQHHDLARTISHCRQPQVKAHTGRVPQGNGHHTGRHALQAFELRTTAQLVDQGLAFVLAVQQQSSVLAACSLIGREQAANFGPLLCRTWVGIRQSAGGANRGAGPAAHAQVRVDLDLLAAFFRADGLCRANVDASIAAHLLVATVRAKLLLVGKETGLFKLSDQAAHLDQGGEVLPIPLEITLRQSMRAKAGRGVLAPQVEHHIETFGLRAGIASEIDGPSGLTCLDTLTVCAAAGQVHLVIEANGLLGASGYTSVAAGTEVQINRVAGVP